MIAGLFLISIQGLFSAPQTGYSGQPDFPDRIQELKGIIEQWAFSPSYPNAGDLRLSLYTDRYIEVFFRLQDEALSPLILSVLKQSRDPYILCKLLYQLRYIPVSFEDRKVILRLLDHQNKEVVLFALICMGFQNQIFSTNDLSGFQTENFYFSQVLKWCLERLRWNDLNAKKTLPDTYYKAGMPVQAYRARNPEYYLAEVFLPLADVFNDPVLHYEEELVFSTPRNSFGAGGGNVHTGDDCAWFRDGTPVFAAGAGIVRLVFSSLTWGNLILIEHRTGETNYICSLYAHCGEHIFVRAGQIVSAGQMIATTGLAYSFENGGYGSHLHFALAEGRWLKPQYRSGYHLQIPVNGKMVVGRILEVKEEEVIFQTDSGIFGMKKNKDGLNEKLQWIKGYQLKQDGTKGWLDPLRFLRQRLEPEKSTGEGSIQSP